MSRTVFVTGGTGFLGQHLVPMLCQAGHRVRALTRRQQAASWLMKLPRVELVRGDLLSPETFRAALVDCDWVVHAGGLFSFWGRAEEFYKANVVGTENLLRAAAGAGVTGFVHISTAAVIGTPSPTHPMDEDYPPQPVEPYQVSKLLGETLALRWQREHGLPVVILRPGAYYGPLGHYAFNRLFFRDPMRGIIMQMDGGRYIQFPVYIADVARAVLLAFERGRPGEIYHICGEWISHREAFDIVCQEAGLPWPRLSIPGWVGLWVSRIMSAAGLLAGREPFWPINLRSYVYNYWRVSSEKARRELGFVPTGFREGARRTIAWYRAGQPKRLPELECRDD
ncbi:MAG: NAD-dependent epimerase/dehydratase family protein [Aggregatilineales bacterium]